MAQRWSHYNAKCVHEKFLSNIEETRIQKEQLINQLR